MVVSALEIGVGWSSWLYTVENLKGFQPCTITWFYLAAGTSSRPCGMKYLAHDETGRTLAPVLHKGFQSNKI